MFSPLFQSLLSIKQLEQLEQFRIVNRLYNKSPEPLEIMFILKIKLLTISHVSILPVFIIPEPQLENSYMCIDVNADPDLFKRLYGLKIKSLTLVGNVERLEANHVPQLWYALSSLQQLEEIIILAQNDSPGLWQPLFGLRIKLLNIGTEQKGLELKHVSSFLTSLSSLKQLDTVIINTKK
ncbi:hypothetical protein DPMN_158838 [Dreissena polymorpha]|uniref:Uncharacterized protein n=1 Tax=Dreissena polymorpha TaxID=45954 RepID=A0A9D4EJV6_DREPO|nr:hypothetical protein DPMN_158838 [Dreissena polymorpha]